MALTERVIKAPLRILLCHSLRTLRKTTARTSRGETLFPQAKIEEPGTHVFFGYYDYSPFSVDETMLLALHAPFENKTPEPDDRIRIVLYDMNDVQKPALEVGESATWCWQQGCRLQWYPRDKMEYLLYNRMVGRGYGCVVQHARSREIEREINRPVYDVSPDGKWGLSLNFSRLHRLRPGYGYVGLEDRTRGDPAPANDGIWRVDFASGKAILLFSIKEVAAFHPLETMRNAEHYFNHVSINPTGTRFLFFHLWEGERGRQGRLITCDEQGRDWCLLNNDGHTSHYTWLDSSLVLDYATHKETGMHFYEYRDRSDERRIIGKKLLDQDGHPSYSPDGRWILLDTYPDRCRDQHLYLYDTRNDARIEIGRFYSPFSFWKDLRCDLHPRWSPLGNYVCVDQPQANGFRAIGLLDVQKGLARMETSKGSTAVANGPASRDLG